MLSGGLSIRKTADGVGMHYRALYGWVLAAGRSRRTPAQ
jgi:transposase-like protein